MADDGQPLLGAAPPSASARARAHRRRAALALVGTGFAVGMVVSSTREAARRSPGVALADRWPGAARNQSAASNCVWHEPHWRHGRSVGHYECFNTSSEADAYAQGRAHVYNVNGDDDDYRMPFSYNCDVFDDDTVYSPDTCGEYDEETCQGSGNGKSYGFIDGNGTTFTPGGCVNGTACYDWCGVACDEGWWSYCAWSLIANMPSVCNGTYDPSTPDRRLRDAGPTTCALHSFCAACGEGNRYCNELWHFYTDENVTNSGHNQLINVVVRPVALKAWCAHWDLGYSPQNKTLPDDGRRRQRA